MDTWDTQETINWASGTDEHLYKECERLAKKFKDKPQRKQRLIKQAIVDSGVLKGTGVKVSKVDWKEVVDSFGDS